MIEDIVQIRPQSKKNYHTEKLEFATPVFHPKEKANHFFQWGLIYHAKGKPSDAYRYYEKAILHHKNPLYIKQMGILHHEMGYFKDALKYLRLAFEIEKDLQVEKERAKRKQESPDFTGQLPFAFSSNTYSEEMPHYSVNTSI